MRICASDCWFLSFSVYIPSKSYLLYHDGYLARANSSSALFKWIFSSLRFATQPYSANAHDTSNRFIHLTNYSVNKVINLQKFTHPVCHMVDFLLIAISLLFYQFVIEQMNKKTQTNQHRISANVESKSYHNLWHVPCKQNYVGYKNCKQSDKYRQAITLSTTRHLPRKAATSGDWKLFGRYNHFHCHFHFHCHLHLHSLV